MIGWNACRRPGWSSEKVSGGSAGSPWQVYEALNGQLQAHRAALGPDPSFESYMLHKYEHRRRRKACPYTEYIGRHLLEQLAVRK